MELDRHNIERRDFPPARRGYDPDEVDRHLRQIAEAVEQLRSTVPAAPSMSRVAAERVQAIVEAAEASAREIEERAQQDAERARAEAEQIVRDSRANADEQAGEHVQRAEEMADRLVRRAEELEKQVEEVLAGLQAAARGVVETLRGGSAALHSELQDMRADLGSAHEAHVQVPAATTPPPAPAPEPEPAPEPAPDATLEHEAAPPVEEAGGDGGRVSEGARLIALNMALSGTPREETARYLSENFDLEDQDELLDEVYARAGG